jgi:hypothetical protein
MTFMSWTLYKLSLDGTGGYGSKWEYFAAKWYDLGCGKSIFGGGDNVSLRVGQSQV